MTNTVNAWTWQCQDCMRECVPIRAESRCMCGHRLRDHEEGHKCSNKSCSCPQFTFVVAEGSWILRCRCKHKHTEHCPASHACKKPACTCKGFHSPWVCNCDHPWANHHQIMVERQVLRLSDMFTQQQEAVEQRQDQQQQQILATGEEPSGHRGAQTAAASAAPQLSVAKPMQKQGLVPDSPHSAGAAVPSVVAPADQAISRQSGSKFAELKASRIKQQLSRQQREGDLLTASASVSEAEGAATASDGVIVKGDLDCEVNRWDLLQRGV